MEDETPAGELTEAQILSIAGRIKGRSRSKAKSAANPVVAERMREIQAKARLKNTKNLDDIPCCGRDPHLKSCLRYKAMVRRGLA
jgi:hypothetical protein